MYLTKVVWNFGKIIRTRASLCFVERLQIIEGGVKMYVYMCMNIYDNGLDFLMVLSISEYKQDNCSILLTCDG